MNEIYWYIFFVGMIVLLFGAYYVLEVGGDINHMTGMLPMNGDVILSSNTHVTSQYEP